MNSSTGIMILFLALERVQNNAPKNRLCALVASHPPDPHFVHDMFPTEIRNAGAHLKFTPTMSIHVGQELPAVEMNTVFTRPICLRQAVLCPSPQVRVGRQMLVEFFRVRNMISYVTSMIPSSQCWICMDFPIFSDMILYSWCSCWVSCIKLCIDDNNMTPMPYHLPPAFYEPYTTLHSE